MPMRQFIRHPVDVPIELRAHRGEPPSALHTHDVSRGGLAVHAVEAAEPGAMIEICIPYVQPAFRACARVAWCHPREDGPGYEIGLGFLDAADAFSARMVEQVCYIEDYRRAVAREEGRTLSAEEAACEWIEKFAANFPGASAADLN